ncbi:hypothetical protein JCM21900_000086 [Sporobolomyces salmonicolor]
MEQLEEHHCFDGIFRKYKIPSVKALGGLSAQINVFLPKQALANEFGVTTAKVPVLYYLGGLTCNEDTGAFKGGFIRDAAAEGIALVFTDTSPRGAGIEGEDKDWDFGVGAGWYLDATSEKYSKYYNMYTYITSELPTYLASLPIDTSRASVHGHSMGGHGALVLYLKSVKSAKHAYASASAYAPCSNPTKSPWGIKAFGGYLKGGVEEGKEWDATELLKSVKGKELKILVDVGTEDHFHRQDLLLPENFVEMRDLVGFSEKDVEVNFRSGYDHSYYMVSTFAPTHVKWHAKILKSLPNKL